MHVWRLHVCRQLFCFSDSLLLFSKTEEIQHYSLHVKATDVILTVLQLFRAEVTVFC